METDRGWAWVVMGAVMASTFLEMGTFKTFGIFFVAFLEKYEASATATSLVTSVYAVGFSIFALPVMTCAIERFSSRQLVMFGGFCLFLSYFLSSFATSFGFIIFAQGVLSALASACIHGPSIVILNRYFEKRRGFAVGMAISFGSMGGIIFPISFTKLMQEYSLSEALFIQSSILLNVVAAGSLLRPIWLTRKLTDYKKWNQKKKDKTKNDISQDSFVTMNHCGVLKKLNLQLETKEFLTKDEDCSKEENKIRFLHLKGEEDNTCEMSTSVKSNISQFSSSRDIFSASMAEIRQIEKKTDIIPEESRECVCAGYSLPNFVDLSVCKMKIVILFAFVFSFGSVACSLPFTFIPPYAHQKGMSNTQVAMMAATSCACEFVGRICCGAFADMNIIQRYKIVMFGLSIVGTILQLTQFLVEFWHFELFCVLSSLFGGFLSTLYSPVCIDFIGPDQFHKAIGILYASQGILGGATVAFIGLLRDISGDYVIGFHVIGACGLFAFVLLYFVPYVKEKRRWSSDETDE